LSLIDKKILLGLISKSRHKDIDEKSNEKKAMSIIEEMIENTPDLKDAPKMKQTPSTFSNIFEGQLSPLELKRKKGNKTSKEKKKKNSKNLPKTNDLNFSIIPLSN
jgi:hypothetical protein